MASANADPRKVRPLVFQLDDSSVPAPFRHIQIPHGDRREDMEQFFADIIDNYTDNAKNSRSAGQRLNKVLDEYLSAVGKALLNAPLLPTEAAIEEWCLRLENLSHANRASEVAQLHQWLNLAFGRDEEKVARPLDLRIHRRLGEIYLSAKNYKRAAEQFDLARQLAPRDIFILRNLGQALVSDRDFAKGEEVLKKITELDLEAFERNTECAALKGRWHRDQEQWQQAHDVYQKAYDKTPESYYLADLLGQMKLRLKNLDEAKQVYLAALNNLNRLAEHNVWTHATAANAAIVAGDLAEARRHLEALRELRPSPTQAESIVRGIKEVGSQAGTTPEEINSLCSTLKL
jgi:tetratricopeptide (TPR) repeat protein